MQWFRSWLLPNSVEKQLVLRNKLTVCKVQIIFYYNYFSSIPHTLLWISIHYQLQYVSSVERITYSGQVVLFGNVNQTALFYASVRITEQKIQTSYHKTSTSTLCYAISIWERFTFVSLKGSFLNCWAYLWSSKSHINIWYLKSCKIKNMKHSELTFRLGRKLPVTLYISYSTGWTTNSEDIIANTSNTTITSAWMCSINLESIILCHTADRM
jgi:hypothetical protein